MERKLTIHTGGRYLAWENGEPFFYLADTAWELFHRAGLNEIEEYLDIRKEQGFTAVQAVALAELSGLTAANPQGHVPAQKEYWEDIDRAVRMAKEREMVFAILPAWGDKWNRKGGVGPEVLNPENAFEYGKWLGSRYREDWNLIWVLGGDRPIETKEQECTIDAMAAGLREGDGGNHLITFHPCGAACSVDFLRNREYMDFHSIQSGHGLECYESMGMLKRTWEEERRPVLDMECRYEDFPACFRPDLGYRWTDADVRSNLYWNMLEGGALGAVYGQRDVWCIAQGERDETAGNWELGYRNWREMLRRPGAEQVKHLKALRMKHAYFELRPAMELLDQRVPNPCGRTHISAARGEDYAYFYTPAGLPVYTDLESLGASVIRADWFSPRDGEWVPAGVVSGKEKVFVTPEMGTDWGLCLTFARQK